MTTSAQTDLHGSERVLYTLTPAPVGLKIFLGLLAAAFLAGAGVFAHSPAPRSVGWWFALAILLFFVCCCVHVVMFRGYVAWDTVTRELIVSSRGLIPPIRRRRFPTTGIVSVRVRAARGCFTSGVSGWQLWLVPSSGAARLLTLLGQEEPAADVAATVARAIGVSVSGP
jgi:hypothetical protein